MCYNIYTAVQSLEILRWMCYEGTQTADRRAGKAVSGKDKRGRTELAERNYKLKQCSLCRKNFNPHSSAAKYCPQCHPKMLRLWAERSANNAKLKYRLEHETFVEPHDFLKSCIKAAEAFDLEST